jgi:hypothetical protein
MNPPPPLERETDVDAFLNWASRMRAQDRERAQAVVAGAAGNPPVVARMIQEVEQPRKRDFARTLLTLGFLGWLKNETALAFLAEFVRRPLPSQGTIVDGEIVERRQQEQLQAKAVDGLAFANTPATNTLVLSIITSHPSTIVRAEAINAYLWNRGDSAEAKRELRQVALPEDQIFIDRVRRRRGERTETFNTKLDAFRTLHPETDAKPPQKLPGNGPAPSATAPPTDIPPPPF